MAIQSSVQIFVALVVTTVVILATYFFTQLYHARNLIYERQKMGLVSNVNNRKECAADIL